MIGDHKKSDIVIGVKQVTRALEEGCVLSVIYAEDADSHIIEPVIRLCSDKGIAVTRVKSKKELGANAGIDVSASVVANIK